MPAPQPVATGDPITSSHENSVVAAFTLGHVEWSQSSASTATATSASVGTLVYDATPSNLSTSQLATISTNTLTIVEAGLYDLSVSAGLGTAPTGETYVQATDGTSVWRVMAVTVSATFGGVLFSAWRLPAGTVLTFTFRHTSAANRTLASRFAMTKVGYY